MVDTAHGHNRDVALAVERVKKLSNSAQVIAGNVATAGATTGYVLSNGIYGGILVKDSSGVIGFAARPSGNITRFDDTTGTTLADNSNVLP